MAAKLLLIPASLSHLIDIQQQKVADRPTRRPAGRRGDQWLRQGHLTAAIAQ